MRVDLRKLALVVAFGLLTSACGPYWTRVKTPEMTAPDQSFSIRAPVGWVWASGAADRLAFTRDGPFTHWMEVLRRDHNKAFANTERSVAADTLPSELAQYEVAELRAELQMNDLELVHSEAVTVGGKAGFEVLVQYRTPKGLRVHILTRGFADESGLYLFRYRAPRLHFYERDYDIFDGIVRSFRQLPGTKA